jgi:UDP-N-acetylglucosamine--N-acetylmuramyl-(pentapeptide) pyrophosphoryl-undecaprenol N-acetylglucosamine transferase
MPAKFSDIRIAFAGGGTGGHLFPALAIAEELKTRGVRKIEFFGTSYGVENRLVPLNGYTLHRIWIKGYPRRLKPEAFLIPLKMTVSVIQCLTILTKFWPDCLVATGGYVCLPFMIAGKLLGLPLVVHEQNSLPGITTRIGAHWAKAVFYSFPVSAKYFPHHRDAFLSGNPVNKGLGEIPKARAISELGLCSEKKTVLVFGGSQGSATLNRAVSEIAGKLSEKFNLIWQTGKGNLPTNIPSGAIAREFFDNMSQVYSAADIAVCRSGAMTIAELSAVGLPAMFVPFPFAAEDHQRLNAEPLAEAGAAVLILDKDFNGKVMWDNLLKLLGLPSKLREMSENMRAFHHPQATTIIVDKIMKIALKEI